MAPCWVKGFGIEAGATSISGSIRPLVPWPVTTCSAVPGANRRLLMLWAPPFEFVFKERLRFSGVVVVVALLLFLTKLLVPLIRTEPGAIRSRSLVMEERSIGDDVFSLIFFSGVTVVTALVSLVMLLRPLTTFRSDPGAKRSFSALKDGERVLVDVVVVVVGDDVDPAFPVVILDF